MQIIKVSRVEVKEGVSKKSSKPYTQYIVHGEDGSSVSTFDIMAASIQAGDSIEAEVEVSGKYTNLKSFKVPGHATPPTPAIPAPLKTESPPPTPVVGRSAIDDRIAEQVAVKAVVELACYKVLEPTHPLVTAVKSWCCDKLRGYLSMFPTGIPKPAEKPAETQPEGKASVPIMDTGMLLNSIKHRLKYSTDKAATQWLLQQNEIPAERIENEPGAVYAEMKEKYHWI